MWLALLLLVAVASGLYFWLLREPRKASAAGKAGSSGEPGVVATTDARPAAKGKRKAKSPAAPPPSGGKAKKFVAGRISDSGIASHPLLTDTVKGSWTVTCIAVHPRGEAVAVAGMDSSVRVMTVDLGKAEGSPYASPQQTVRAVLEGMDVAACLDFSADGKSLFAALDYRNNLVRLRIENDSKGKPLQATMKCDTTMHKERVRFLSSSKGDFVVTAGDASDTAIKVWGYNGDLLATCDTKQITNYQVNVSPVEGRFFGAAAWTSGVKLWEVLRSREGVFTKVEKAMDLSTTCGTLAVAISHDNTRAAAVTKDLKLILWRIDVRYHMSEDTKQLKAVAIDDTRFHKVSDLHFSPDSRFLVLAAEKNLMFFDAQELTAVEAVVGAHGSVIDQVAIPATGCQFLTVASEEKPRFWRFPA